jgi:hypothetical protein
VILQASACFGGAVATSLFLPGATVGGLLLRLDPGLVSAMRGALLAGPGPWAWDAALVLLSAPLWILPAAAGSVLLLLAWFRPPRRTVSSWADWIGRHCAQRLPAPSARNRSVRQRS